MTSAGKYQSQPSDRSFGRVGTPCRPLSRPRPKPRNTAMVGARLRRVRHRAENRGAAETHPTPAARTQQRIEAYRKTANFLMVRLNTMVRCVCHHAAYFHIHVLPWALSGASDRYEFRECAALLLPPTLLSQHKERRRGNECK